MCNPLCKEVLHFNNPFILTKDSINRREAAGDIIILNIKVIISFHAAYLHNLKAICFFLCNKITRCVVLIKVFIYLFPFIYSRFINLSYHI